MGLDNTASTLFGICLCIVGSLTQAVAFIIQKKGHLNNAELNKDKPKEEHKEIVSNKIWLLGLGLYAVGGTLNAVALRFAPQSMITPLGSLVLVGNTILAWKFLGEKLPAEDIIGIIIIIIGNVLLVTFGPRSDVDEINIDILTSYYSSLPFIIFSIVYFSVALSDFILTKFVEYKNFKDESNTEITYGGNFLMLSYTFIASFFGSMNILFQKSTIYLISSSVSSASNRNTNLSNPLTYIVIVAFITCLLSMEYFRQRGLAYFGALYVVPTYAVLQIIGATLAGAIYFQELSNTETYKLIIFFIGILITLIGVFILAWDIGKILQEIKSKIAVAYETKDDIKGMDTKNAIPVYGGPIANYYQQRHLRKKPYFYNVKFEGINQGINTDAEHSAL